MKDRIFQVIAIITASTILAVGGAILTLQNRITKIEFSTQSQPHAQLSSAITMPAPAHGQVIEMEHVDSIHEIRHDRKRSESAVEIKHSGEYLVIASPQVALSRNQTESCIDTWIQLNNYDLNNTTVTKCWKDGSTQETDVLVLQAILQLEQGDRIQIVMRSIPHESAQIVAIHNEDAPLTPSIIFTLIKVSDI